MLAFTDRSVHRAQGDNPIPLPLHVATAGKNHLNEEIAPLLPTRRGERCSQTISNMGHEALLRRCELLLVPINESAELSGRSSSYSVIHFSETSGQKIHPRKTHNYL
jgi:hypothetical protein